MYFAVLLVFLAVLIAILIWQLPKLHRFDDRTVVFVISAIVGLISALVTFGALKSYGHLSGQTVGVAFELGGPAALFLLVLILGTKSPRRDAAPFTFTVILHEGANGRSVAAVSGKITLLLSGGARDAAVIDGQAVFEALEIEHKNHSVDFLLSVPGYTGYPDAPQLRLTPGSVTHIRVQRTGL